MVGWLFLMAPEKDMLRKAGQTTIIYDKKVINVKMLKRLKKIQTKKLQIQIFNYRLENAHKNELVENV